MSLDEVNRILICVYGDSPTLILSCAGNESRGGKTETDRAEPQFPGIHLAEGYRGAGTALCRRLPGQRTLQAEI